MSTLQLFSIVTNIVLGITLLYVVFSSKAIQYINKLKKRRENKANLERARLIKTIREEVRRYLEELQK
jgi:hypothetical protein